jgi:hypothetical protein
MKKLLMILFCMGAVTVYTSCKKTDVPNTPVSPKDSATIMGFKDSTQLIKSIREYSYDSATDAITDSTITYLYYDTVNRKISLKLKDYSDPSESSLDSFQYSYNSSGLLVQFANKSSQANATNPNLITEDIVYDASNIVKTVIDNYADGSTFTFSMNKTSLANGSYSLNWYDLLNAPDTAYYTVNFDNTGRTTSYYFDQYSDSIIYDGTGNMSQVKRTEYPPLPNAPRTYVLYDFVSRDTKGDQLYNLNRILNNGIANFSDETSFSVLSEFDYQYIKYPALATNVLRFPNGYGSGDVNGYTINFTSTPQYDNQNRLVKYKIFFNDIPFSYFEDVITYYK